MSKIHLGNAEDGAEVYIDIPTLVATRLLVTASSGGGKSETLRRILEEAVGHIQCIVIDPEGEFSTLREQKPFVLVGEGGETPADIRTAALVATRLLELNASAVCDIYEMKVHERHEWVKRFLDSLVHAPKSLWHPMIVVVDEAHTYCPEAGYGKSVAAQSVIDLCNLGRKRGFCSILATQRLSKLDKNAVEPLQNYLLGLTMFDDQKRAAETFKVPGGAPTREFSLELERLKPGQFIARGRAITGDMLKVQVTRGMTRPPKTGTAMAGVVTPAPEAIKALLPKLADLPHEAEKKAKTEDDLRRELGETRRQVTELRRQLDTQQTQSNSREIAMLKETLAQLQNEADEMEKQLEAYQRRIKKAAEIAKTLSDTLSEPELEKVVRSFVAPKPQVLPPAKVAPQVRLPKSPTAESTANGLTGPEQRIVNAIAWLEELGVENPEQPAVAFLAGYTYNAGGFNNPKGSLRGKGLVEYIPGERICLTEAGRGVALALDIPATNEALHEAVLAKLPNPEGRILRPLLHAWPKAMSNERLAEAANYAADSGGFNNPRGRLRSLGLVEYPQPGMVRAKDLLFPER